jgi:hypothetical protein
MKQFGGSNFARLLAPIIPNMAWGIFKMFEKKNPYSHQFLDFPVKQKLETNFFLGAP